MQETYLIKLRDNFSKEDLRKVVSFLKKCMSQIIMFSLQDGWIVAAMDQEFAETIKKSSAIALVGGVTFRKRLVRVIRIQK